jgi:hypothetical protein
VRNLGDASVQLSLFSPRLCQKNRASVSSNGTNNIGYRADEEVPERDQSIDERIQLTEWWTVARVQVSCLVERFGRIMKKLC